MDPNAALNHIRQLLADIDTDDAATDRECDLSASVEALDDWLTNGGFLPAQWQSFGDTDR